MRGTRAQTVSLLLLLVCLFGCNAGQVLRVASAAAITTARVATVLAVAAARSQPRVNVHAEPETVAAVNVADETDGPGDEVPPALEDCTELEVQVVPPPSADQGPAPRAVDCGGIVLIQDQAGHWHHYNEPPAPPPPGI